MLAANTQSEEKALADLTEQYPAYESTYRLDDLRTTEYVRLDRQKHVYLDYTGDSLYAVSQLRDHIGLLASDVFGHPHSKNLTSLTMTERVEQVRAYVLKYFNASPDEYVAIFTSNATGALKLVGEAYPFDAESACLLTFDNHNSVNGTREFARAKGSHVLHPARAARSAGEPSRSGRVFADGRSGEK